MVVVKEPIFVVEDDPDILRLIQHHLESASFVVRIFTSGANLLTEASAQHPVLFLLDVMLPGESGLELCKRIRSKASLVGVPIIFVTARSSENDRVSGFELGADDYITKPFSPRELVARVKAVLRRFERPLQPTVTHLGDLEMDTGAMTLNVRGKPVAT